MVQLCAHYIIFLLLWYVRHTKLYTQHGSMNIHCKCKYSIAHSHVWATDRICRSNLANCKFTLVLIYHTALYRSKGSKVSKERVRQSSVVSSTLTAQGAAKNAIKIDVLLTDCETVTLNRGS